MYKSILVGLIFTITLPFASAQAIGNLNSADDFLVPAKTAAGYEEGDIGNITGQIINTALQLVGIIFLGLMVYAGYLWMTAQGEESQIEKAKKIVTSAIIGLILTLSAYAITTLVTSKFSGGPQGGDPSGNGPEMVDTPCNRCIDACARRPDQNACIAQCDSGVCQAPQGGR